MDDQSAKTRTLALAAAIVLLTCWGAHRSAAGAEMTDIGGMVALDGNTPAQQRYLVVNDKKDRDRPEDQGPRVGIVSVIDDQGLTYTELDIPAEAWGSRPANDLEAACKVPGTDFTYLLLESSYYKDRYGRIFMVRVRTTGPEAYRLEVLRTYQLPRSGPAFNLEGIACFPWRNRLYLLLGDRGDYAANSDDQNPCRRGTLLYARLPVQDGEITWSKLADLVAPAFANLSHEGYRHCSDLFMQPIPGRSGRYHLWVAASYDPDNKTGPFRSEIYLAGTVNTETMSADQLFTPWPNARSGWRSDAVKVEALALSLTSEAGLCVGSDDEALGGVWRNLGAMTPRESE